MNLGLHLIITRQTGLSKGFFLSETNNWLAFGPERDGLLRKENFLQMRDSLFAVWEACAQVETAVVSAVGT